MMAVNNVQGALNQATTDRFAGSKKKFDAASKAAKHGANSSKGAKDGKAAASSSAGGQTIRIQSVSKFLLGNPDASPQGQAIKSHQQQGYHSIDANSPVPKASEIDPGSVETQYADGDNGVIFLKLKDGTKLIVSKKLLSQANKSDLYPSYLDAAQQATGNSANPPDNNPLNNQNPPNNNPPNNQNPPDNNPPNNQNPPDNNPPQNNPLIPEPNPDSQNPHNPPPTENPNNPNSNNPPDKNPIPAVEKVPDPEPYNGKSNGDAQTWSTHDNKEAQTWMRYLTPYSEPDSQVALQLANDIGGVAGAHADHSPADLINNHDSQGLLQLANDISGVAGAHADHALVDLNNNNNGINSIRHKFIAPGRANGIIDARDRLLNDNAVMKQIAARNPDGTLKYTDYAGNDVASDAKTKHHVKIDAGKLADLAKRMRKSMRDASNTARNYFHAKPGKQSAADKADPVARQEAVATSIVQAFRPVLDDAGANASQDGLVNKQDLLAVGVHGDNQHLPQALTNAARFYATSGTLKDVDGVAAGSALDGMFNNKDLALHLQNANTNDDGDATQQQVITTLKRQAYSQTINAAGGDASKVKFNNNGSDFAKDDQSSPADRAMALQTLTTQVARYQAGLDNYSWDYSNDAGKHKVPTADQKKLIDSMNERIHTLQSDPGIKDVVSQDNVNKNLQNIVANDPSVASAVEKEYGDFKQNALKNAFASNQANKDKSGDASGNPIDNKVLTYSGKAQFFTNALGQDADKEANARWSAFAASNANAADSVKDRYKALLAPDAAQTMADKRDGINVGDAQNAIALLKIGYERTLGSDETNKLQTEVVKKGLDNERDKLNDKATADTLDNGLKTLGIDNKDDFTQFVKDHKSQLGIDNADTFDPTEIWGGIQDLTDLMRRGAQLKDGLDQLNKGKTHKAFRSGTFQGIEGIAYGLTLLGNAHPKTAQDKAALASSAMGTAGFLTDSASRVVGKQANALKDIGTKLTSAQSDLNGLQNQITNIDANSKLYLDQISGYRSDIQVLNGQRQQVMIKLVGARRRNPPDQAKINKLTGRIKDIDGQIAIKDHKIDGKMDQLRGEQTKYGKNYGDLVNEYKTKNTELSTLRSQRSATRLGIPGLKNASASTIKRVAKFAPVVTGSGVDIFATAAIVGGATGIAAARDQLGNGDNVNGALTVTDGALGVASGTVGGANGSTALVKSIANVFGNDAAGASKGAQAAAKLAASITPRILGALGTATSIVGTVASLGDLIYTIVTDVRTAKKYVAGRDEVSQELNNTLPQFGINVLDDTKLWDNNSNSTSLTVAGKKHQDEATKEKPDSADNDPDVAPDIPGVLSNEITYANDNYDPNSVAG